jgi:hypothetical protein
MPWIRGIHQGSALCEDENAVVVMMKISSEKTEMLRNREITRLRGLYRDKI